MGIINKIRGPVMAQLLADNQRQADYIKQLEGNISVLENAYSQDKEFVITQNKILSQNLTRLENSLRFLYSDCSSFSYFKKAWEKHLVRLGK